MAIIRSSLDIFRANSPQDAPTQDMITHTPLTRAVVINPCGHVCNEATVISLLAQERICPLDDVPITGFLPYTMPNPALPTNARAGEQKKTSEQAQTYFKRGKELLENDRHQEAMDAFLKGWQLSSEHEKTEALLDVSLRRVAAS